MMVIQGLYNRITEPPFFLEGGTKKNTSTALAAPRSMPISRRAAAFAAPSRRCVGVEVARYGGVLKLGLPPTAKMGASKGKYPLKYGR